MKKIKSICILFVLGAVFFFLPSIGQTALPPVNCANSESLQDAINAASPGATIPVTGTCYGNFIVDTFHSYITIDGGGGAILQSTDPTQTTVTILGQRVTIKNFQNITGGDVGVLVYLGGSAMIDNNKISNNQYYGVLIYGNSFARITNNLIDSNPNTGVLVLQNSTALIGVMIGLDTAQPNTIQNNGSGITVDETSSAVIAWNTIMLNTDVGLKVLDHSSALIGVTSMGNTTSQPNTIKHNGNTGNKNGGVWVTQSSSAVIVGNAVSNNTGPGIKVDRGSQADISGNHINGNSDNGTSVAHNSGVNLGNKTGTTIYDLPNMTGTKNGMRGISCTMGGYVDGLIGSLNGNQGPTLFTNGCISGL